LRAKQTSREPKNTKTATPTPLVTRENRATHRASCQTGHFCWLAVMVIGRWREISRALF
jgi:hypothetical protein